VPVLLDALEAAEAKLYGVLSDYGVERTRAEDAERGWTLATEKLDALQAAAERPVARQEPGRFSRPRPRRYYRWRSR
jgi:hypothetical protein